METLTLEPQDQDLSQARQTSALAGSLALHERIEDPSKTEAVYPRAFEGVMVSEIPKTLMNEGRSGNLTISPAAFDEIEAIGSPKIVLNDGSKIFYYDVFSQMTDDMVPTPLDNPDGSPKIDPTPDTRLVIVKTADGVRYTVIEPWGESMQNPSGDRNSLTQYLELEISGDPAGARFLEQLGYIFVNGQTYAPSPETFKAFCAQQGINVKIFKDKSTLGHEEYLQAYIDGEYPIGALDSFYSHDIQDDHITALMLGGPDLQAEIAKALSEILAREDIDPDIIASKLDSFTNTFRSVIIHGGSLGEAYGKESGRRTLKNFFDYIPIPPEKIDELITIAQNRARGYGLEPKALL